MRELLIRLVLAEPDECATASSSLPSVECVIASASDLVFPNGIVLHDVRLRKPDSSLPPPPPGGSQVVSFSGDASGQISLDGGATFSRWGGHCWDGTCRYTSRLDSGSARFFDTEMLALSLSGGGLPAGVMIRESPTKASSRSPKASSSALGTRSPPAPMAKPSAARDLSVKQTPVRAGPASSGWRFATW